MHSKNRSNIIYKLEDNPPVIEKFFAAIQHLCAILVPMMLPGYIVCKALGYDINTTAQIISTCLVVSGIGTFLQAKSFGIVGSGLLSIQGTSFIFVPILIITGKAGGLSLIFGSCLIGSLATIAAAPFIKKLRKILTPTVTGVVIVLIGISLLPIAAQSSAGGQLQNQMVHLEISPTLSLLR